MAYEKDAFVDPAVTEVAFYASHAYGNFTRTAAPTWENAGGNLACADSLGDAVAANGLAVDVLDGQRKLRLDCDSDNAGGPTEAWRIDLDLNSFIEADFAIIDNHTLRDAYDEAVRNQVDVYHDANATFNGSTALTPTKFFSGLLGKGRPYMVFDGVDDKVTVSDSAQLDFGYSDGAIEMIIKMPDVSGDIYFYPRREDGNNLIRLMYDQSTGRLQGLCYIGGASLQQAECSWTPVVNTKYHVIWTFINGTSNNLYISGINQTLVTDTKTGGDLSIASDLTFGLWSATYQRKNMILCRHWNRNLSAAEALTLYNGWTHTPIPVANQWGASTELMPNQVDRDFSGASAWTNVDLDVYDETGDLSIATATAAAQYCTLPVASAPMTATYRYRLEFDVANLVSTWAIKDFTGAQTLGTVTANGTDQSIEFTVNAGLTGGLRLVTLAGDSAGDFDNFSLIRVGCVAEWAPDGIQSGESRWRDSSPNSLDGTITGATAKDEPSTTNGDGDCTIIEFTEVEKQYWFWVFNVDAATSDADTEIGQLALGKKFTCAVRPDLNVVKLDGYGLNGRETLGGRRSVNYRHGKRRGWQLNWSYVSQAEYENFQRFFDTIETTKDSSKCPWSRYPFWFTLNNDGNEPVFHFGRVMGVPEIRELTYEAYAISVVIETEV